MERLRHLQQEHIKKGGYSMNWNPAEGFIEFDALWTTAIALLLLMTGYTLRKKIAFLDKYCIPAPVIGGLLMSFILLIMHHSGGSAIKFTTSLQTPLMIAFFTTVGIGGSLSSLKRGGSALIVYLFCCWGLAIFQNAFGSGLAYLLGIHPMFGVMAGAVSLEGGHGAAAAFGPVAEGLGVVGAKTVAIASATFGLMAGGFIGGPIAFYLIKKNKLEIKASDEAIYKKTAHDENADGFFTSKEFLNMLALVLVIMVLGGVVSTKIKELLAFVLPGYVGAMFIAVLFRNINDHAKLIQINDRAVELMADVSIGVFLTMAMMTLRIWELYDLAGPLLIILILQVIAIILIAIFILFPALGKNYDAAVMCAGFAGHGLGATPNAVANMGAVCEKYKVLSHKAFLIVPLSGAVLIDLVAVPNITWFINFLGK